MRLSYKLFSAALISLSSIQPVQAEIVAIPIQLDMHWNTEAKQEDTQTIMHFQFRHASSKDFYVVFYKNDTSPDGINNNTLYLDDKASFGYDFLYDKLEIFSNPNITRNTFCNISNPDVIPKAIIIKDNNHVACTVTLVPK